MYNKLPRKAAAELIRAHGPKVAAGSLMRVSSEEVLADGSKRMLVALDGDTEALGWVTGFTKDEVALGFCILRRPSGHGPDEWDMFVVARAPQVEALNRRRPLERAALEDELAFLLAANGALIKMTDEVG